MNKYDQKSKAGSRNGNGSDDPAPMTAEQIEEQDNRGNLAVQTPAQDDASLELGPLGQHGAKHD